MNTTKEKFKVRNALFEKEDKTDEELELEMEKKLREFPKELKLNRKNYSRKIREKR